MLPTVNPFPFIPVAPVQVVRMTNLDFFYTARNLGAGQSGNLFNLNELYMAALGSAVNTSLGLPPLPSSWQLFGTFNTVSGRVFIPGVGEVPVSQLSTYAPNARIHFVGACSCLACTGLQAAGGAAGHNFSQGLIYIEPNISRAIQLRLPNGATIQYTFELPRVRRTPIEEFDRRSTSGDGGSGGDGGSNNSSNTAFTIISLIVSITVQAALQAAQDHRVWLGVRFGATGNMYRQELTGQENRTPRQMPKTGMQFNGFPGPVPIESNPAYNPFAHHTGIQDLPVFDRVPIARREAVKVPVRFDSYATVNAFDYVGGFNDHLSNNDIRNFVEAYLSLQ